LTRLLRNVTGVLAVTGVTVNTLLCFVPLMLLAIVKLLLPFPGLRARLTRGIMAIGEFWVAVNARVFGAVNATRWRVSGLDGLSPRNWYLIIANHQTWVDIIVLQTIFNRRVPFLKFFIKQQLVWFPFLGLAWWAMDMPFMKRHSKSYLARHPEKKGSDLEATRKACEKFRSTPTSVINFIEGTRYSPEKSQRRNSTYRHLLPPRAGGIALALSSMGEMFDALLDVTVVYPSGPPPRFWQLACGDVAEVVVDVRQVPIDEWMITGDYANDRAYRSRFHQWLTQVWEQKDARIDSLLAEFAERPRMRSTGS